MRIKKGLSLFRPPLKIRSPRRSSLRCFPLDSFFPSELIDYFLFFSLARSPQSLTYIVYLLIELDHDAGLWIECRWWAWVFLILSTICCYSIDASVVLFEQFRWCFCLSFWSFVFLWIYGKGKSCGARWGGWSWFCQLKFWFLYVLVSIRWKNCRYLNLVGRFTGVCYWFSCIWLRFSAKCSS